MADDKPQDCPTRMALGLGSGFLAGNFFGAVASNWGDVPLVLRNRPLPALARTGATMLNYGTTLGLVGLAFSTVDVRQSITRQLAVRIVPCLTLPDPAPPEVLRACAPGPATPCASVCSAWQRASAGRRTG